MALERLNLDGKVAIITGGARGVGRGIADVLAEAGASVVISARTQADLDDAVAKIKARGGKAAALACDVTREADNRRLIDAALERFGRIDILVNNAGGAKAVPFMEETADKFARDFHFNVISAFQLTQMAAPHLIAAGGGSVVNISSRSAQVGGRGFTTYSVAKLGLERLTHIMAQELAPHIRVNAISLGTIMSDGLQGYLDSNPELKASFYGKIPLGRVGDAADIGLAALYLCSAGCYATGAVIRVDGGITSSIS